MTTLEKLDTSGVHHDSTLSLFTPASAVTPVAAVLTAPTNTTISRKVHQVLTISSSLGDNDQLRTALQYMGTFYGENTINERRNLRGVLERKTLDTHKDLLHEFSKVNEV